MIPWNNSEKENWDKARDWNFAATEKGIWGPISNDLM